MTTLSSVSTTAAVIGGAGVAALSVEDAMRLVTGGFLFGMTPAVLGTISVVLLALAASFNPQRSAARVIVPAVLIVQAISRTAISVDVPVLYWGITAAHVLAPYVAFVAAFLITRNRSSTWFRLFGVSAMVASAWWAIGDWAPVMPPVGLPVARSIADVCFVGVLALPAARVLVRRASELWASADIR